LFKWNTAIGMLYFFSTDENPIPEMNEIIKKKNQTRFKYLEMDEFLMPYEDLYYGYDSTDEAVKYCPSDTRWLLFTNGDNEYSPKTFNYLEEEYDAIAFDFYSRYSEYIEITSKEAQEDPAKASHLFQYLHRDRDTSKEVIGKMNEHCSDCKNQYISSFPDEVDHCYSLNPEHCFWNGLSPIYTDLGATIWNYQRWQTENRNFTHYSPACCHDGFVASELFSAEWTVKRVPICLFSHSPNPWSACRHLIENGYTT